MYFCSLSSYHMYFVQTRVDVIYLLTKYINRAHSFPWQILQNFVVQFAKFCSSPQKIVQIPRPAITFHLRVNCTDSGSVVEGYTTRI